MKFKIQNIIFNASMKIQNPKYYFQHEYGIQNPKHYFQTQGNYCKFQLPKFKTINVILMCLEILLHKHKAVIKVPGIAKQTVNRK